MTCVAGTVPRQDRFTKKEVQNTSQVNPEPINLHTLNRGEIFAPLPSLDLKKIILLIEWCSLPKNRIVPRLSIVAIPGVAVDIN